MIHDSQHAPLPPVCACVLFIFSHVKPQKYLESEAEADMKCNVCGLKEKLNGIFNSPLRTRA